MRYLKYRWDENRGDEHSDWGASWWYFEVDPDGSIIRQIEIYDLGVQLRYSRDHPEDELGGLASSRVDEFDRPADNELSAIEFNRDWEQGPWFNSPASR